MVETPSRTILAVVGIPVAAVVIAWLVIFVPPPGSAPSLSTGPNVRVNLYAPGSDWAGGWGEDPEMAVAANGTLFVVWWGVEALDSAADTSGAVPPNTTAVWLATSTDGGAEFSAPIRVSPSDQPYVFDPTVAVAASGGLTLAWVNESSAGSEEGLSVASAPAGSLSFAVRTLAEAPVVARPWLVSLPDGSLALAYSNDTATLWSVSIDLGATFSPFAEIPGTGYATSATSDGPNLLLLAGLGPGATEGGTVPLWFAAVNTTTGTVRASAPGETYLEYPTELAATNMSHPGPAIAVAGTTIYLAYDGENQSSIELVTSTDGGVGWSGAITVVSGVDRQYAMPDLLASPSGARLALSWESDASGYWDEYAVVARTPVTSFSAVGLASSASGLPADVLNDHGSFTALAATNATGFVLAWNDGRDVVDSDYASNVYACFVTTPFA